ncbi:Hypothetical protein FKW44_016003 [Caligus rogercresseyi]|uniref:PiggyBac transposable element-derived protein domain-containing protein n=1 Tax=Caligus rogercresseyi TaxID=217165 RepID=A0A7T8H181_CALRO|nr:Hypothetical protein FKW44_016003 [Caligus rogercresseyi]
MKLAEQYLNERRNINSDNFFTTLKLAKSLKKKEYEHCGNYGNNEEGGAQSNQEHETASEFCNSIEA